jgi:hypothetical protein
MLINIGGKDFKKDKKKEEEKKVLTQTEKNDLKLNELISSLPNYSCFNTKYIEYPEGMFNLLK